MANAKPKFVLGLGVVAIVLGVLYAGGLALYASDTGTDVATLSQGNVPADHLKLDVHVGALDLAKQTVDLSIEPEPQGGLTQDGGWTSDKDIGFTITTGGTLKTVTIKAGEVMAPQLITVPLDGEISTYPFDKYDGTLFLDSDLPLVVNLDSHIQAIHATFEKGEHPKETALEADMTFSRSLSIVAFALFVYSLMAMIAVVAVIVTISVNWRGYDLNFGHLGWAAALLFVLPSVRGSLPGAPPIGALMDFIVFFWAEFLVVACMVTMVFGWLRTAKPKPAVPAIHTEEDIP